MVSNFVFMQEHVDLMMCISSFGSYPSVLSYSEVIVFVLFNQLHMIIILFLLSHEACLFSHQKQKVGVRRWSRICE